MVGGDFPGWLADLLGQAVTTDLTDTRGECVYTACAHFRKCFIERQVRKARRAGVEHVHIHSCATAAHLGALGHILGDLNYSLTLHGDLPVYGTDHRAKMQRACFVSAVTRPLQKSLEAHIGPGRPYPLIWMGVDTDRFRPAPDRAERTPTSQYGKGNPAPGPTLGTGCCVGTPLT